MTHLDPLSDPRAALVRSFHESSTELVVALSGGGSLVLGDLLTMPGASRTLIEATVPYSEESLSQYIGRVPEQFCCQRTARYMAMTAFHRGLRYIRARNAAAKQLLTRPMKPHSVDVSHDLDDSHFYTDNAQVMTEDDLDDFFHLIGVGCTASLVTNREKKGEYRVHVAVQTLRRTIVFSLQLIKDARTRCEEERLVADLILNAIETTRYVTLTPPDLSAEPGKTSEKPNVPPFPLSTSGQPICHTFGVGTTDDFPLRQRIPLDLKEGETILGKQTIGSPPLVDLFFGKTWAVLWQGGQILYYKLRKELPTTQPTVFNPQAEFTQAIFPGSFNPIHKGHLEMIDIAEHRLGNRVALEISVQNIDKPPLDYIELEYRLAEIEKVHPGQAVWFTQTPLFEDKSQLFRESMFVVGTDTLRRFADLRFYHESTHQLHDVLRMIAYHNCRFLVFARKNRDGTTDSLETISIPDMLRSLCDEVPEDIFAMNISSSDLRRNEF